MGTASSALTMAPLVILLLAVAVSCEPDAEPYTLGQVAAGATAGGVITGVDYGHGLVSGVGAVGTGRVATVAAAVPAVPVVRTLHPVNTVPVVSTAAVTHTLPYHVYGKRDADPEPYTVGQIAAGAHIANALADGRPHNVGVITNAAVHPAVYSVPHYVYGKREADPALVTTYGHVLPYTHSVVTANTGLGHAVAATPVGLTHSANVGVCTNYVGAVVPC